MLKNVTGGYSHQAPVIHNVSFAVHKGEWLGLIGLNGAGKSTTIKHILGLLVPHKGSITLNGHFLEHEPKIYRRKLAYIPEVPQFYDELTLWEHLELTAKAYELDEGTFRTRAEQLLAAFQMKKVMDWFPTTFSKGMQQKLMILCAFLVEPDFFIIDEPFIGLDPLATKELIHFLEERKKAGTGILMSTHRLDMAEKYCDRLVILHQGHIVYQGNLEQLRKQVNQPQASLEEIFFQIISAKDESRI